MDYQCVNCKHIWSRYRGGFPNNCPNCGTVCTWNTVQRPDYGADKRKEYSERNRKSPSWHLHGAAPSR